MLARAEVNLRCSAPYAHPISVVGVSMGGAFIVKSDPLALTFFLFEELTDIIDNLLGVTVQVISFTRHGDLEIWSSN